MKTPHVRAKKYTRILSKTKRKARSELALSEWTRQQLAMIDFCPAEPLHESCPKIDYVQVSREEFIKKWEQPGLPVIITNAMADWPCMTKWSPTLLGYTYRHEKFKVGEDDDEKVVYMGLKYYLHYALHDPQ
ncbi:jumonji domain-containing protein 6, partial [Kappamyces sp. JEL0829]